MDNGNPMDKVNSWSDLARCAYHKITPIVGDRIAVKVVEKGCEEANTDPYKLSAKHLEAFAPYISKVIKVYNQLDSKKMEDDIRKCAPIKPF